MKTKMSLSAEIDLTQDSVVQLTCWCGQIALHELWGLGRTRLDRITRREELLGNQSLAVVMQPDKNGMPQTEKARRLRAEALPKGVPSEFRVPALRTPRTRREQQLKMVGDRAATLEWRGYAAACAQVLGFGTQRLEKLRQETIANFGQLNEWVEQDGVDVAMEMLCRCARDAYKTDVEVLDVPDEAVLEKQRRETAATVRQLEVQAVRQEVSRMRVPCVLPLSDAEVKRKIDAAMQEEGTNVNLSPLRSGCASALRSSPNRGAKN